MRIRLGAGTIGAALAVTLMVPGIAAASWTKTATGAGSARATSVQAPATASASPTTGATSSSITVSWTAPAAGPAPTSYRVDRVSPAGTVCTVSASVLTCADSGRTPSTSYSYNVVALVNLWNGTVTGAGATTAAAAATLAISTVVRDGGNKKVHFTGVGAVAGTTITVTICAVNTFPCASPVTTSVVTSPIAGNWTSAQSPNNLATSQTYFAQAVQGASTSVSFSFSTTNL